MNLPELIKTIDLGDRSCERIVLDGPSEQIEVHVDLISRVRDPSGNWNYYSAEDIPNGRLVFGGVQDFRMTPAGLLPNDFINDLRIEDVQSSTGKEQNYRFLLSIGSVNERGATAEVTLEITARDFFLKDPRHPEREIRE